MLSSDGPIFNLRFKKLRSNGPEHIVGGSLAHQNHHAISEYKIMYPILLKGSLLLLFVYLQLDLLVLRF
jgi:hypothetical protein